MKIDYSTSGKVKLTMYDYIEGMLEELPSDMDGVVVTPAGNHLFQVNHENPMLLDEQECAMFHHNVAKLLFLCKRSRPDIQTAVAFLTTRVKEPDVDDYKKLSRVMRSLRATREMPLTLEAETMCVIKWWVDTVFAVHPDMKGHTGGFMTMGKGTLYGTSKWQKLVTQSLTEAELVGVYDLMPQVLWTRHFLEAQGYTVSDSVVHQDNKSAIQLEENGRASSSKRTRHLNIRYFFMAEHVKSGNISVKYCPTADMVSDYYTKPLQGGLFRKQRAVIMNIDPDVASHWDHRSVLEEQKGTSDQQSDQMGASAKNSGVTPKSP
jgi:hypothetical protein